MLDLKLLIREKVESFFISEHHLDLGDIPIEHPENMGFGDYSSSVSLVVASELKRSPMEIASELCAYLNVHIPKDIFEKIDYVSPGFVNFTLSYKFLLESASKIIENSERFGWGDIYKNKKFIIEYTDPNPFKVFHIGHLMPNVIGESISRLIESQGAEIKRANYQGDVGMHVAKSIWGMTKLMQQQELTLETLENKPLFERVDFLGKSYALGATAFIEGESEKASIQQLNKKIYDLDSSVKELYEKGRAWSLEYFETLYERLGTKFDYYYFEREAGSAGLKASLDLLENGVFEKNEGAIIFRAEKYGLHTRVFVNSFGIPTYESKDLGLAMTKYEDFPYDCSIIVTSNEIDEYFKVVLKAMEFIYPDLAEKTKHISHGNLRLKTGKMSSRTGDIVAGDELMNKVRDIVLDRMDDKDKYIADKIAIAAIKYGILKNNIGGDIIYDEELWLSITGDTGPYLQYTYARANSVLTALKNKVETGEGNLGKFNEDESILMRSLYIFSEVVRKSAQDMSPNTLAVYLNSLARKFNTFYSNNRILECTDEKKKEFRIVLTECVRIIMKNGLWLLGIEAPEKM